MRYPGEENKSDSINISSGSNSQLLGGFSSSSTSASSQDQDDSNGGGGENIATISEHVLFGNNNGHNRFLYLYYSESSTRNNNSTKRPYTTGGGTEPDKGISKMGSSGQQQPSWNDLSGLASGYKRSSGRGSAGPSPISYGMNDGDDYDFDDTKSQMKSLVGSGNPMKNEVTPYPVYLSPVEGSPTLMPSSPEKSSETQADTNNGREKRMDSLTGEFLDDDDWDRIYSVPDVNSRYIFSPEPTTEQKSEDMENVRRGEEPSRLQVKKSNSNLSVSKPSPISSASSSKLLTAQGHHSRAGSKRVRVTPEASLKGTSGRSGGHGSMKKWSSTSSVQSKKRSPMASSTPSAKSQRKGNSQNQHGVTHHHHQPINGNDPGKRVSCATTGEDGVDHISLRNGIGAYFGTRASKMMSQIHEPTPEEMYNEEMQGWRSRLTTSMTIFAATLFILSCSSLLFVFPILVDPILVGFEAKFSDEPVTCRTTNFRNGSGSSECAIPSCREGCTLDLFSCIFVEVEYSIRNKISQINPNLANNSFNDSANTSSISNTSILSPAHLEDDGSKRSAILLININGCGYPPAVTCSEFERKFAPLHTEFPCYFSHSNESIVVPHYSRHTEIIHLTLAVCIPIGVALTSGISLYLLVRYNTSLKASIYRKYAARKKALRAKKLERIKIEEEEKKDEEDVTSISELEPVEDYEHKAKVVKATQNGNSRIGIENSHMLTSTQM